MYPCYPWRHYFPNYIADFANAGMASFVKEDHLKTYTSFYQDFTGRTLRRRVPASTTGSSTAGLSTAASSTAGLSTAGSSTAGSSVKREAGPTSSKELPKVKVQKMEQPLVEGLGSGVSTVTTSPELSTELLDSGQCLDSGTHLNRGKTSKTVTTSPKLSTELLDSGESRTHLKQRQGKQKTKRREYKPRP